MPAFRQFLTDFQLFWLLLIVKVCTLRWCYWSGFPMPLKKMLRTKVAKKCTLTRGIGVKTVNESPTLLPTSKIQLNHTEYNLDNPTLEPVAVIINQDVQQEQLNLLERPSSIHIHYRLCC